MSINSALINRLALEKICEVPLTVLVYYTNTESDAYPQDINALSATQSSKDSGYIECGILNVPVVDPDYQVIIVAAANWNSCKGASTKRGTTHITRAYLYKQDTNQLIADFKLDIAKMTANINPVIRLVLTLEK